MSSCPAGAGGPRERLGLLLLQGATLGSPVPCPLAAGLPHRAGNEGQSDLQAWGPGGTLGGSLLWSPLTARSRADVVWAPGKGVLPILGKYQEIWAASLYKRKPLMAD